MVGTNNDKWYRHIGVTIHVAIIAKCVSELCQEFEPGRIGDLMVPQNGVLVDVQ